MQKITREDIQRIGDEDTLLHFLQEKLNLPIPEGATLAQIALPLPLPFLGLDGFIAEQIIDCQDFSGLPQGGLSERRPFLIRFRYESNYSEVIRAVAEGLHQKNTNPLNLFFFCTDESFQPFAFAYFNDSESEDWQAAVLNILAWIQDNTHIHTSSEHELPIGFFVNEPSEDFEDKSDIFGKEAVTATSGDENDHDDSLTNERIDEEIADNNILADAGARSKTAVDELWEILNNKATSPKVEPISPEVLSAKLKDIGMPLGQLAEIYSGHRIQPGCSEAFVLNESKYQQLINADIKSKELIKPVVRMCLERKWKPERKSLIWIPSSQVGQWPWSDASNELEAERIFADTYPAISRHLFIYKNKLKVLAAKKKVKFYWESPLPIPHSKFYQSKIIYYADGMFLAASYDESGSFILGNYTPFIPTKDLSLLAILNSKLFHLYAKTNFQADFKMPKPKDFLTFKKENMVTFPVANRTGTQKAELSDLVQQILDAPNSPAVPDLEEKINILVYDLYDLTPTEIALIDRAI